MTQPRRALCRNCHQPIFRALHHLGSCWVHVSPRWYYCPVQQAQGYRPVAEPAEPAEPALPDGKTKGASA
jgi:hypothetical protein